MRYLLDTHAFLWWISGDERLSQAAIAVIQDSSNEIFLSAASAWELAIKAQLGKLALTKGNLSIFVVEQMALNNVSALPISVSHALHVNTLPALHKDPFDRLLVAQSMIERLPLITSDPLISQYQATTVW